MRRRLSNRWALLGMALLSALIMVAALHSATDMVVEAGRGPITIDRISITPATSIPVGQTIRVSMRVAATTRKPIVIELTARDRRGQIAWQQRWADETFPTRASRLFSTSSTIPADQPAGEYILLARAYDSAGRTLESARPVHYQVTAQPMNVARSRSTPTPPAIATPTASPSPVPSAPPAAQRLIFAYYYYWYDAQTGGHLQDSVLRYHYPATPAPSWRDPAWHKKELADMAYAGIDVVLPVYWGFDRPGDGWSTAGLAPLVAARQELLAEGRPAPAIGMFFDTAILDRRDLTTAEGRAYFYANIRDFFSRVPRRDWALVDGRPVIFLFTSDFAGAVNQRTFDDVYKRFRADFGIRPYIVREVSWDYAFSGWLGDQRLREYDHPLSTDASYLWGAAFHGYVDRGEVAAIGPGYDDTLVPGRGQVPTDRENGAFYQRAWEAALASRKRLVAIETWNELHEGSGINETIEYRRQYLDLTRQYAARFHAIP